MKVSTGGSFRAIVTGEQREGLCGKCGTLTIKEFYMDGSRRRVRMICPKCGGQGRLIVRTTSIQAPPPLQCFKLKCWLRFFRNMFLLALLTRYHHKRVAYATTYRHKNIAERYRTGNPSPHTIWQAIRENIKLSFRRS